MPLTAVRWKDYDGTERTDDVDALLDLAAADPFFPVPYNILRSMLQREERPPGVSVTMCLSYCLRCEVLKKYTDYTADLEKMWPAWRGTTYHTNLENHSLETDIVEVRFWATLPDGSEVHGKPDLIRVPLAGDPYIGGCTLLDLKTTAQVPIWDRVWANHNEQLQHYRWLINNATRWEGDVKGLDPTRLAIDRLGIWYVDDKKAKPLEVRKKTQVATTSPGAKNPYRTVKVPDVWTDEEVLAMLQPRYDRVVQAFDLYETEGTLPPYPPGFDFIRSFAHQWSPVAEKCVMSWFAEKNERTVLTDAR